MLIICNNITYAQDETYISRESAGTFFLSNFVDLGSDNIIRWPTTPINWRLNSNGCGGDVSTDNTRAAKLHLTNGKMI